MTDDFVAGLPEIRAILESDIRAAYDGDPGRFERLPDTLPILGHGLFSRVDELEPAAPREGVAELAEARGSGPPLLLAPPGRELMAECHDSFPAGG